MDASQPPIGAASTLAPAPRRLGPAGRAALGLSTAVVIGLLAAAGLAFWPAAERADDTPMARDREALLRHLREVPRDARAWVLLGLQDLEAGRYDSAAQAFERGIAASPRVAADAGVWVDRAEAQAMAQGGSLAGQPTRWVDHALSLRGTHPKALEMAGSAAYERRDFAAAARHWRTLLAQLPPSDTHHAALAQAIERAERLAATSLR